MASSKPKNGGKSSKGTSGKGDSAERVVAENRKARHHYEILDTLECGIALVGSEVKSLRSGKMSLDEAYGRVKGNEVWLIGCDIPEYVKANQLNHQPKRPRKLLLHRREIVRFASLAYEKSLTLVPLKAYFKEGTSESSAWNWSRSEGSRQATKTKGTDSETRYCSCSARSWKSLITLSNYFLGYKK
jgi:SsrA-binding protein